MFDPKHESKLLKVHNSRDVIACSNSNLMIRYFHRYRHALLGLPRIQGRVATTTVSIKIRPCRRRLKRTATSTMQCIYSSVSKASLRKTGVFLIRLETLGNYRRKKFEHQSLETIGDEKSPHLAGLSHQGKKILQKQECLAGAGGFELTHSRFENAL